MFPTQKEQPSTRPWSKEQEGYLIEKLGINYISSIADKIGRTENAVLIKMRRLGINRSNNQGRFTARHVAKLLRLSCQKIITKQWVRLGLKIYNVKCHRLIYNIDVDELVRFFTLHPEAYDYRGASDKAEFLLELNKVPDPPTQKLVECRGTSFRSRNPWSKKINVSQGHGPYRFWVPIYADRIRCQKCGRAVSKFSVGEYR